MQKAKLEADIKQETCRRCKSKADADAKSRDIKLKLAGLRNKPI
jgi:hypothetical protein